MNILQPEFHYRTTLDLNEINSKIQTNLKKSGYMGLNVYKGFSTVSLFEIRTFNYQPAGFPVTAKGRSTRTNHGTELVITWHFSKLIYIVSFVLLVASIALAVDSTALVDGRTLNVTGRLVSAGQIFMIGHLVIGLLTYLPFRAFKKELEQTLQLEKKNNGRSSLSQHISTPPPKWGYPLRCIVLK